MYIPKGATKTKTLPHPEPEKDFLEFCCPIQVGCLDYDQPRRKVAVL